MIAGFFQRNLGLKALSLTLALLAWAYLTYGANPRVRAGVAQQVEVPVVLRDVAPGLVAEPVAPAVTALVSGDRGPFGSLSAREFAAVVDVRGRGPGTYSVVPRIVGPKDVDVERVRPASVVVTIDRVVTRRLPVYVQYSGKPAQGSTLGGAKVAPATVTVRGSAAAVGRVAAIAADVPTDRAAAGFDALLAPVALDVKGRRVTDLVIAPNLVHVTVTKAGS
ncbi:MAG TPA: hypothetical protein VNJ51_03245 [Candidatus Dormibacteraeota bacterium]|nr:hypothetical protein [Candidatus Dormibacteraeota bacterium]